LLIGVVEIISDGSSFLGDLIGLVTYKLLSISRKNSNFPTGVSTISLFPSLVNLKSVISSPLFNAFKYSDIVIFPSSATLVSTSKLLINVSKLTAVFFAPLLLPRLGVGVVVGDVYSGGVCSAGGFYSSTEADSSGGVCSPTGVCSV